jgi:hypothetical protein
VFFHSKNKEFIIKEVKLKGFIDQWMGTHTLEIGKGEVFPREDPQFLAEPDTSEGQVVKRQHCDPEAFQKEAQQSETHLLVI